jgi:hypothetical protein
MHEFHEYEGRRWPVILAYVLASLAVAVALIFSVRWAYRLSIGHSVKKPATGHLKKISLKIAPGSNAIAKGSSAPNLPNNGPGDVAAVFVGSAAAGGGVHYIIKRRRDA